ncbi:uncharacterized protein LOC106639289 [Copidosoma floridanum]|uniref:uncharacterized protein LOC106639289 n=1 Tax=Copidosoma floridanum TaxID=29053 RepID=UPI0006C9B0B9|nr:uncharacterized protein LOC106639289 [Copidosoma floridanum]
MAITRWWRLAIAAGMSECLVYAEAKYCAFEIHGEPKYYVCPKTEYCCNFGCCVSPGFQMYHLWYYWLLVIIMFLVCSGGGWWYRYWLHGRFRTTASAIPNRSSSTRAQGAMRDPTCRAQQARISYNTARNTVLLHRMWKAHRGVTSPAYTAAGPASSNTHYQNTSVVLNDVNCPYYQLYGPPPSYETVIAQSRGKLSTPSSPELLRPGQSSATVTVPAAAPTGFVGPCFYSVRPLPSLEAPQYQPPSASCAPPPPPPPPPALVEGFDTAEYVRLIQQYQCPGVVAGPTVMASPRHQLAYAELRAPVSGMPASGNGNHSSDAETVTNCSQAESPEGWRIDCLGPVCPSVGGRMQPCYVGKPTYRVAVHELGSRAKFDPASSSPQPDLPTEPSTSSSQPSSDLRRVQGGSLKIPRRRELRHQEVHAAARASRRLSSASDHPYHQVGPVATGPQPIPSSSNVIPAPTPQLAAASASTSNHHHRDDSGMNRQQRQPRDTDERPGSSTNSNVESKRKKLDRSKSLD